jgi:hypothetical protein
MYRLGSRAVAMWWHGLEKFKSDCALLIFLSLILQANNELLNRVVSKAV